ncbi:MAG: hypothetical protein KKB51_02660 [Candidatus Riflebacteria bacterium]|nr:hypothetical protein [Candidatus Riflebacteria bacterium]
MKFLQRILPACLIFASLSIPSLIFAQQATTIPGQFSGNIGRGLKIELNASKAGKYLFKHKVIDAERKGNISISPKFQNNIKIILLNEGNSEIASNYYPEDRDNNRKPHYSDYFVVNLKATGTYFLQLSPLSEAANDKNFQVVTEFTAPPTTIMGMELYNLLSMIGTVVLLSFMLVFYKFVIKPFKNMNVEEIMKKSEELRQLRK